MKSKQGILLLLGFQIFINYCNCQLSVDSIILISHQGNYELAENHFNDRYNKKGKELESSIGRAFNYSWWGKYEQAETFFLDIIKNDRANQNALTGLAYTYRFMGNYPKSVQYFTKAISIDPKNLNAHKGLIYNYLDNDKLAGAKYHLKKSRQVSPYDAELFYVEGLIKLQNQDFKGAKKAFRYSLELDSNYQPSNYQLSRMVSSPSRWEITPWVGMSKIDDASRLGLRRLDIFYNANSRQLLYAFWDNTLSFENNFLVLNSKRSNILGIGNSISWNKVLNSNIRISYSEVEDQSATWDTRLEQNVFISERWRIQAGAQIAFNKSLVSRIFSFSNEVKLANFIHLEGSIFSTYNYHSKNYKSTIAVIPKFYFAHNIEFLVGAIVEDRSDEVAPRPIGWKGFYTILSFPLTDNLFSRILYLHQTEVNSEVRSLAFGLSCKF